MRLSGKRPPRTKAWLTGTRPPRSKRWLRASVVAWDMRAVVTRKMTETKPATLMATQAVAAPEI